MIQLTLHGIRTVTTDRQVLRCPRIFGQLRPTALILSAAFGLFGTSAIQAQPALIAPIQSVLQNGAELLPLKEISLPLIDTARTKLSGLDDAGLARLVRQGLLPLEAVLRDLPDAERMWLSMPLSDDLQSQQQIAQEASLLIAQLRYWQSGSAMRQEAIATGTGVERAREEGAMDPVVSIARQVRLIASRLFSAAHGEQERLPKGLDSLLQYTQNRVERFSSDEVLPGGPVTALMDQLAEQMPRIKQMTPAEWPQVASGLHRSALQLENMAKMQDSRTMQAALKQLRSKLPLTETGQAWRYELDRALALLEQQGWGDMVTMNSLLADWELLAEAH